MTVSEYAHLAAAAMLEAETEFRTATGQWPHLGRSERDLYLFRAQLLIKMILAAPSGLFVEEKDGIS